MIQLLVNTDDVIKFYSTTTGFKYTCRVDGLIREDELGRISDIFSPYEFTTRGCKTKEARKWKVYRAVRKADADYINNLIYINNLNKGEN